MKVYVLVTGMYETVSVHGVYATVEAAKAAWSPTPQEHFGATRKHLYTWVFESGAWRFDADWDDYASIEEYEVAL